MGLHRASDAVSNDPLHGRAIPLATAMRDAWLAEVRRAGRTTLSLSRATGLSRTTVGRQLDAVLIPTLDVFIALAEASGLEVTLRYRDGREILPHPPAPDAPIRRRRRNRPLDGAPSS